MLYRLQQVSSRRLLSNLVSEFRRELPRHQAQEALRPAALIDGLWLRAALSGKPLDKPLCTLADPSLYYSAFTHRLTEET